MRSSLCARNAILSQRKSGIFQNPSLNEPLGCMRPPQDIKPITDLSIICFVHALGGDPMLPHIEIHRKSMCGTRASTYAQTRASTRAQAEPGQGRGNRTRGLFRENPFGPKTCQGKPLRGNFFDRKTPPTPKRKTSEQIPVRKQYVSGPATIFTPEKENL